MEVQTNPRKMARVGYIDASCLLYRPRPRVEAHDGNSLTPGSLARWSRIPSGIIRSLTRSCSENTREREEGGKSGGKNFQGCRFRSFRFVSRAVRRDEVNGERGRGRKGERLRQNGVRNGYNQERKTYTLSAAGADLRPTPIHARPRSNKTGRGGTFLPERKYFKRKEVQRPSSNARELAGSQSDGTGSGTEKPPSPPPILSAARTRLAIEKPSRAGQLAYLVSRPNELEIQVEPFGNHFRVLREEYVLVGLQPAKRKAQIQGRDGGGTGGGRELIFQHRLCETSSDQSNFQKLSI